MFFFDHELQLYINDSPLLISSRVVKAARRLNIQLRWNNKGHVQGVSYDVAMALSANLGIQVLSVSEFMSLVKREPRVASSEFAEWLTDRYTLSKSGKMLDAQGKVVRAPTARPGWFDLEDCDERGLPTKLSYMNVPSMWKFWTPGSSEWEAGAMRSFVTSSGTCSLDLGIPTFAQHPMIMIRECYRTKVERTTSPLEALYNDYQLLTLSKNDQKIEAFFESLDLPEMDTTNPMDEFVKDKEKEMAVDLLGKKRLLSGQFRNLLIIDRAAIIRTLATPAQEDTTYVIGHRRPDADAIVSAVFEATRRSLLSPDRTYLPQSEYLPQEVRHVLGNEISSLLRLSELSEVGPQNNLVLVDTHEIDKEITHLVRSIIDHHIVTTTFPYYVALSQEVSWSSTLQVYIKILGSGMDLDRGAAKILTEATKLEAEPTLWKHMSALDRKCMQRLESIAGPTASYVDLMKIMTEDAADDEETFYRDYKEASYGFAVVKSTKSRNLDQLARKNNSERGFPLTVVKQIIYESNFTNVSEESIAFIFSDLTYDKGFRAAVVDIVAEACQALHGKDHVTRTANLVTVKMAQMQTPRLLLMPLIEEVVKEHLGFAYSQAINRYISRGFYSGSTLKYGSAGQKAKSTQLSFRKAKKILAESTNTSLMTLPQYWQVYEEFNGQNMTHMVQSLRDEVNVELLDTVIYDKHLVKNGRSEALDVSIAEATPALIRPQEGDQVTGIPTKTHDPNNYGDDSLWRYWSPDCEENVATRGHIFVMDQTSIDLKIRPIEKTANLTFRPIYQDIPPIKYCLEPDAENKWVKLSIMPRMYSIFEM